MERRAEGLEGISIPEEQGAAGRASAKAQDWDQREGLRNGSKWSEQRVVGWAGQTLI